MPQTFTRQDCNKNTLIFGKGAIDCLFYSESLITKDQSKYINTNNDPDNSKQVIFNVKYSLVKHVKKCFELFSIQFAQQV